MPAPDNPLWFCTVGQSSTRRTVSCIAAAQPIRQAMNRQTPRSTEAETMIGKRMAYELTAMAVVSVSQAAIAGFALFAAGALAAQRANAAFWSKEWTE